MEVKAALAWVVSVVTYKAEIVNQKRGRELHIMPAEEHKLKVARDHLPPMAVQEQTAPNTKEERAATETHTTRHWEAAGVAGGMEEEVVALHLEMLSVEAAVRHTR